MDKHKQVILFLITVIITIQSIGIWWPFST